MNPLVATYRLQLTPTFGFADAAELLDPIRSLGVSHLYLSPVAEAVTGSTHGYDVVDHRRVRAEFGGEDGLIALLDSAGERDLAVMIDHVPNHASVERAESNPHWWAMLRDGPTSDSSRWFDVDWEFTDGKVIVPKLGEPLHDVVDQGALVIVEGPDGHELRYGPLHFPMAAGTELLELREAVDAQHYSLTWWRSPERNVRRFFTIDDLVAVRVEEPEVAAEVDSIPRRLAGHRAFGGVRVDHIDGLADPETYLHGLRETIGDRWLVVEKIVAPGETVPRAWPIAGTTGYEQITVAEHALLDPAGLPPLDTIWCRLADDAGQPADFEALERVARREVLDGGLRPDLDRLVRLADELSDLSIAELRVGFVELTLALHRYRTYLPDPESVGVLAEAEQSATDRAPEHADAVAHVTELVRTDEAVCTRWQQLTGPVMAKGAEDRAFYRHQRLSSACEVGGDPSSWTLPVDAFHEHQLRMQSRWPTTMLTNTTHDTKRSALVRARSLALVTRAEEWASFVSSWRAGHGTIDASLRATDVSLALQTVATAWPLDVERLTEYLVKAVREADLATAWAEPDEAYEANLRTLAATLIDEADDDARALARYADGLARDGSSIGLRLLALQITCPGVPDLYQGAPVELLSLVDPDNRRQPDWSAWTDLVRSSLEPDAGVDLDQPDVARIRLVGRVLRTRRRHPGAFGPDANYVPVEAGGDDADRVLAFTRSESDARPTVMTVVVRPSTDRVDATVMVPPGGWDDLVHAVPVSSGPADVADLTGEEGVAVLVRRD